MFKRLQQWNLLLTQLSVMAGRKEGWMDGWIDGWIDGWMNG